MKNYLLSTFLVLLLTSCTLSVPKIAQNSKTIKSDKYRLIWNDDPMTTMTIAWNQYKGQPTLHYGLSKETKEKILPQRTTTYRGMKNYFTRLSNLQANSQYFFKICTQQNCGETMYFKTAPAHDEAFTFVAGGDSRSIPKGRIRGN
ncbi:MAG: Unknown protein, partial [uncultured Sulfurovum sp.]